MANEDVVELTNTLVSGERVSRRTMLERDAWNIKDALAYQPVDRIVKQVSVKRQGRVIAWLVDYHYKLEA